MGMDMYKYVEEKSDYMTNSVHTNGEEYRRGAQKMHSIR